MARRPTTPPDSAGADNPEDRRPLRPGTADDRGGVSMLVDPGASSGLSRRAVGSRQPPPRSLAAVVLSIAARREAAPARRARIECGLADPEIRAELLADLDAAHARAEAADLAELLASAPEGRA